MSTHDSVRNPRVYSGSIKKPKAKGNLNVAELKALLAVARKHSERDWQLILCCFYFALRISEALGLRGTDVHDNELVVTGLKHGLTDTYSVNIGVGDLECRLGELAARVGNRRIFHMSRQNADLLMKKYCALAGISRSKAYFHALRHLAGMQIMEKTQRVGLVTIALRHKSPASAFPYLREMDGRDAKAVMANFSVTS